MTDEVVTGGDGGDGGDGGGGRVDYDLRRGRSHPSETMRELRLAQRGRRLPLPPPISRSRRGGKQRASTGEAGCGRVRRGALK